MSIEIIDSKLKQSVERFFEKLEKYFPEHKVFALDNIDKHLRDRLAKLYKETGCDNVEEFLAAYGFEIISSDEARKLRNFVLYTPGNEPDIIKNKIDSILKRLKEIYPNKEIQAGTLSKHNSLNKDISGLCRWLGYENVNEMLQAYGFNAQISDGGRPENDYQSLIDTLKSKYNDDADKVKSVGLIMHDNPELAGKIKSLQNRSNEIFGMSLSKYFKKIGILRDSSSKNSDLSIKEKKEKTEKKKIYHYFEVCIEESGEIVLCIVEPRKINVGDYIEMAELNDDKKFVGRIIKAYYHIAEDELPMNKEEMKKFIRKISKTELKMIMMSKEEYIFCSVKFENVSDTLYYISPFVDIEVSDIVEANLNWRGDVEGIVTKVERFKGDNVPYPINRVKKIKRILIKTKLQREIAKAKFEAFIQRYETVDFLKINIESNILDKYSKITYFSGAVFRGFEIDVCEALEEIYPSSFNYSKYMIELSDGIYQFECPNQFVYNIIEKFPNLKSIFFAEIWNEGNVYLAYSESGYSTVNSLRLIGKCDFYSRDRFTLIHDPSEENFEDGDIKYCFEEKKLWENTDFVILDGTRKILNGPIIPSKPYHKETTMDPVEIIKINWPE